MNHAMRHAAHAIMEEMKKYIIVLHVILVAYLDLKQMAQQIV